MNAVDQVDKPKKKGGNRTVIMKNVEKKKSYAIVWVSKQVKP